MTQRNADENIDYKIKQAEWRGSVLKELEYINSELKEAKENAKITEERAREAARISAEEVAVAAREVQLKLDSLNQKIDTLKDRIDSDLTGVKVKVAGIGGAMGIITTIAMNYLLK